MLKRVLSPGRQSKEQPSPEEQQQAGQRVVAAPVDEQEAGGAAAAALPPRPPVGLRWGALRLLWLPPLASACQPTSRLLWASHARTPLPCSPFDAPAEPTAKPVLPPSGGGGALAQSMSGPPALGRPSVIKSYLSRDETRADISPALQQRLR